MKTLIILILTSSSIFASDTNGLRRIDYTLSKVHYDSKAYIVNNNSSLKQLEHIAQKPEIILNTMYGNCLDFAILTKKLAEEQNLKANIVIERHHAVCRIEINGKAYRYSNGKMTGRCW